MKETDPANFLTGAEREIIEETAKSRGFSQRKWFNKSTKHYSSSSASKVSDISQLRVPTQVRTGESKVSTTPPPPVPSKGIDIVSDVPSEGRRESKIRRGLYFLSPFHPSFHTSATGDNESWYSRTKKGIAAVRKGKSVS